MPLENDSKKSELASVVHENIEALLKHRKYQDSKRNYGQKLADQITHFVGTLRFVLIQVFLISLWILLNVNLIPFITPWDPFPFPELANVCTLEAIFLSIFILITQNRASEMAKRRADLNLQMNLLSEHEITRLITLLDDMSRQLNIKSSAQKGLDELKTDVSPTAVIQEIEKAEKKEDLEFS